MTISVNGMEAYLEEMFQEENPHILDDELPDAFSNWLSQQSLAEINEEAQLYCYKMQGEDTGYLELAEAFYKANFGRLQ